MALHGDRTRGVLDSGLPGLARHPNRSIPGQLNDRRVGRDLNKAATAICVLAIIAAWGTLHGFGPFSRLKTRLCCCCNRLWA